MLQFSVVGIPVKVQTSFWLVAAFLAFGYAPFNLPFVPWAVGVVAIVFVSVLAHELGHAVIARSFGASVDITLYSFGGYTTWGMEREISPWRRVAVAAAGSSVGFALGGLVWGLQHGVGLSRVGLTAGLVTMFVRVNVWWGVLNWLPIRPLDGGHILIGVLQGTLGRWGRRIADWIFPLATIAVGVLAWRYGYIFGAAFAGYVLFGEVQRWFDRPGRRRVARPEDDDEWTGLLFPPEPSPEADASTAASSGETEGPAPDDEVPPPVG